MIYVELEIRYLIKFKDSKEDEHDFEDGSMLDKNLASVRKAIKKFEEGKKVCQN